MHFSANVEESPLQTDAETGGEPEQNLQGRTPGGSQLCCATAGRWGGNTCPVSDGWSRFVIAQGPCHPGKHGDTRVAVAQPLPGVCPCVGALAGTERRG